MSMFLSTDEIETLTGYKLQACQKRWFDSRGWRYEQAAGGRPIILRSYAERKMSDLSQSTAKVEKRTNLDAIRRAA